MPTANDITINYGIAYGSSYTLATNPWPFKTTYKEFRDVFATDAGDLIEYDRAKKLVIEMSFSYVSQAMVVALLAIKNTPPPYQLVLPAAAAPYNGTFAVLWTNDWNFVPKISTWGAGYSGSIIFQQK